MVGPCGCRGKVGQGLCSVALAYWKGNAILDSALIKCMCTCTSGPSAPSLVSMKFSDG